MLVVVVVVVLVTSIGASSSSSFTSRDGDSGAPALESSSVIVTVAAAAAAATDPMGDAAVPPDFNVCNTLRETAGLSSPSNPSFAASTNSEDDTSGEPSEPSSFPRACHDCNDRSILNKHVNTASRSSTSDTRAAPASAIAVRSYKFAACKSQS